MRSLLTAAIVFWSVVSITPQSWAEEKEGHSHGTMTHLVFSDGLVHAHVSWEKGPQLGEESVLRIEWKNGKDHSPLRPQKSFQVVLWMPEMGHGSAPTVIEQAINSSGSPLTGVYNVSGLFFVMAGMWQVNIVLEKEDGSKETNTLEVKIPEEAQDHQHHHH